MNQDIEGILEMSKEERDIMTERYAKELEASMIRRIRKVEHS
jgi:hypothetical protein